MKYALIFCQTLVFLSLISCDWDTSEHFTEQELLFLPYTEGQSLSFRDTENNVYTLSQKEYKRALVEYNAGFFSLGDTYYETYRVDYVSTENNFGFDWELIADPYGNLQIQLFTYDEDNEYQGYYAMVNPRRQVITYSTFEIDGKIYQDVYEITANAYYEPSNNSSLLLHTNQEFGILQIVFPDQKKYVRVD